MSGPNASIWPGSLSSTSAALPRQPRIRIPTIRLMPMPPRHLTVANKLSFLVLCAVGLILLSLGFAAAASAEAESTMSITVGPEPTESITTQLGVAAIVTSTESYVELKVQPSGGERCAANPGADNGASVIEQGGFFPFLSTGPYSDAVNWTFERAGSYLLCGWMTVYGAPVAASAQRTIVVRPPHITLSISAPGSVAPGQTFQLATTAQAETSREVYEYIESQTGRGCPANAAAAGSTAGSTGISWPAAGSPWKVDGGQFTETVNAKIGTVGAYLVCAYAEYPTTESVPEAVASSPISVGTHPPPARCVVPKLKGTTLTQATRLLSRAHCRLGRVTRPKRHKHKLVVVSQNPGAKKTLHSGTKVSLRLA